MNCRRTAQMAFVLGGLLGKNVALEGLTALDGTARTHHEALCSTLLGLHLRHETTPVYLMVMGVRLIQTILTRPSKPTRHLCADSPIPPEPLLFHEPHRLLDA